MTDTPWYNLSEEQRIKEVYSKYTIKEFWNWWAGEQQRMMEVRIKDFTLIKELATKYNLPYSSSGIYVCNDEELKFVMGKIREKAMVWFGVNSRKKNWNRFGHKSFGGLDANVLELVVLFIDIDRVQKEGTASNLELENCNKLANIILERLATQGWNKNYCKVCSGNGVQLLIKLDFPIKIPEQEFDGKNNVYITNVEYEKIKSLIRSGIGNDILLFCRKYQKDLGVEVDKSCFNISRVAALPWTKNFKYGGFTWRGIIELQTGVNEGFGDYVLSKENNVEVYRSTNLFTKKALNARDRIREGKLIENILIKFMLDNDLPAGMRNNYLWFQVKCLLRDSKYDLKNEEFRKVHVLLEKKYGALPINLPDNKFTFDENIVNKYCIINSIPPIYPLWPSRTKRVDKQIEDMQWEDKDIVDEAAVLDTTNDIIADLEVLKKQLTDSPHNRQLFAAFILGCINKYGENTTRYYFDYIMKRYLCYE